MEKIILSLKNIYRLLMNDDFPIYSERVIGKKQRKGQTLLRFWQDIMARDFCCLPYGKLIWRNDGTRNRYISNLCNRSDELKYYHEYAQELGAQITGGTLLDQIRRFLDFCASAYNQLYRNCPELAERMLRVVLESDAPAGQKASAYYGLITIAEYRGQSEASLRWAQTGAAFVLQHPECGRMQTFDVLSGLAMVLLKFGQGEEAKSLLDQIKKLEKAIAMPSVTMRYQLNLGTYELYYGQLDKAAEAEGKALAILEEYYGKNLAYYSTLNQLAIILQRQKRFDQAKEAYEQILAFGKDQVYFNVARNNYAVLLLDMGKPEEAMPYISEVLAVARQQGGIALGEALRNQARANGLLGDNKQEYQCLQEALPLLTEAYGPEHPRVAAAKERLAQLRQGQ